MIQNAAHLPSPHDLGDWFIWCGDCGALHFKDECVYAAELYYVCCADGKVWLPSSFSLPFYLYSLFTAATPEVRHFWQHVNLYNNAMMFIFCMFNLNDCLDVETGGIQSFVI